MFLVELRPEQKELFLDLGILLSKSDGAFNKAEKKVISEMCKEMGITERTENQLDLNEVLRRIRDTAYTREKRIILLETAGIVLADGTYSEEEKGVIKNISDSLKIEYSQYQEVLKTIQELYSVYKKVGDFLSGK